MTFETVCKAAWDAGQAGAWHEDAEVGGDWFSMEDGFNAEVRSVMESCAKLVCRPCAEGISRLVDATASPNKVFCWHAHYYNCAAERIWRVLEEGEAKP